jgi:hypothetical protein
MIVSLVIGSDIPITKQEMAVTFNSIFSGVFYSFETHPLPNRSTILAKMIARELGPMGNRKLAPYIVVGGVPYNNNRVYAK